MAHTGLRRGEIIGLEKSWVVAGRLPAESDPDESGEGRTKSEKWRGVPLNRYAKWALHHARSPRKGAQGHCLGMVQEGFRVCRNWRAAT